MDRGFASEPAWVMAEVAGGGAVEVAVLGATGRQGGAVMAALLARGMAVRALVRDPSQLGAEGGPLSVRRVLLDEPQALAEALEGVEGLFLNLPYQRPGEADDLELQRGLAVIAAAKQAGVRRVVYSSAAGVGRGIDIPELRNKAAVESALAASGLNGIVLRPTFLMQNFLIPPMAEAIRRGTLYFALRPETRLQMIDAADLGEIAAMGFAGPLPLKTPELATDEMAMAEVGRIFSAELGRDTRYAATGYEAVRQFDPNLAVLSEWLDHNTYGADVAAARGLRPGATRLTDWVKRHRMAFV